MAAGDHIPSWTICEVSETGSTNTDLLAMVDRDLATDRQVLRTDYQTVGRGRLNRWWEAPPGLNLLMSVLFLDPPDRPHSLTQAVGLAAVRAVDRWVGVGTDANDFCSPVSLKWPNDVLLNGKKLAGVLAQRHTNGAVIVGIGLNVRWAPEDAIALSDVAVNPPTPSAVFKALLDELEMLVPVGVPVDPVTIADGVRRRMSTIDSQVYVELPGGDVVIGRAVELTDDGAILVATTSGVERFTVGDVVHLRSELGM